MGIPLGEEGNPQAADGAETRPPITSRPSLFLTCRLAGLVQKFKHRLQEKVNLRNSDRKVDHFGSLYQRGFRLRALSDLERVQTPRRRATLRDEPRASAEHPNNAEWLTNLIDEFDSQTSSQGQSITRVAADNQLFFSNAHNSHIEKFAQNASRAQVASAFDLSYVLIDGLESFSSKKPSFEVTPKTRRLEDENYVANLIHLLRRLRYVLFMILVNKSLECLDDAATHWRHDWMQQQKLADDWFCEWPGGRRPLSTTWPWNIRPSLVVLWGVCWQFYDHDNNVDTSPPVDDDDTQVSRRSVLSVLSNPAFWEIFPQQSDPEADFALIQARTQESTLAGPAQAQPQPQAPSPTIQETSLYTTPATNPYSHVTTHAPPHQSTLPSGISIPNDTIAQHDHVYEEPPQTQQSYYGQAQVPHEATGSIPSPVADRSGQANSWSQATYLNNQATTGIEWQPQNYNEVFSSQQPSQLPIQLPQPQLAPTDYYNLQTEQQNIPTVTLQQGDEPPQVINFDWAFEDFMMIQGPGSDIGLSSSTAPMYYGTNYMTMAAHQADMALATNHTGSSHMGNNMGEANTEHGQESPNESSTRRDSTASLHAPANKSPTSEEVYRPPRRQRQPTIQGGMYYCDWSDCNKNRPGFKRKSDWHKHMDTHERPYRCPKECGVEPFTWSGGVLRHLREIHKIGIPDDKREFNCLFEDCRRNKEKFTRYENLKEHYRRRHPQSPVPPRAALKSPTVSPSESNLRYTSEERESTPASAEPSPSKQRKSNKRKAEEEQPIVDYDNYGHPVTSTQGLHGPLEAIPRTTKRPRTTVEDSDDKDRQIKDLQRALEEQKHMVQHLQAQLGTQDHRAGYHHGNSMAGSSQYPR